MKKIGCLNSELSYVLAKLGHFDTLTIGEFQKATIATEAKEQNPDFYSKIYAWANKNGVTVVEVPHVELKAQSASSVAVVRTGECHPYCNVILESNVSF